MNIIERFKAPTPDFFKRLRNIGLSLVATGTVLVSTPIIIPASLVTFGSYLIVAGSVASAIAQSVVSDTINKE